MQTSFFVHFYLFGFIPNIILFLVIILNLLEKEKNLFSLGFFSAALGGFFLDIFSDRFIGFYILISICLVIFIKVFIKRYVRIPIGERI